MYADPRRGLCCSHCHRRMIQPGVFFTFFAAAGAAMLILNCVISPWHGHCLLRGSATLIYCPNPCCGLKPLVSFRISLAAGRIYPPIINSLFQVVAILCNFCCHKIGTFVSLLSNGLTIENTPPLSRHIGDSGEQESSQGKVWPSAFYSHAAALPFVYCVCDRHLSQLFAVTPLWGTPVLLISVLTAGHFTTFQRGKFFCRIPIFVFSIQGVGLDSRSQL